MRFRLAAVLALAPVAVGAASPGVSYREPQSYRELPASFVDSLKKDGCRIPQATVGGKVASNVISGSFAKKGQLDWAALCSKEGHQYIAVFWGGSAQCPSRIDTGPMISDGDRAIDVADRQFILDRFDAYGGPKPPEISHLGIDYRILEKGSEVHYCHEGQWQVLTGAD